MANGFTVSPPLVHFLMAAEAQGRLTTWAFWHQIAPFYFKGAVLTLELTLIAILFGTVIGLFAGLVRVGRSRHLLSKALKTVTGAYTWAMRGTPLLVQIYLVHFGLNQFGLVLQSFQSGAIALSVNAGAYITEIFRAGIQSIDKGQMEAARALGMTYAQAMRRIILPQAYRRMIPPLINEFVALLKDSSLVSVIGMVELMRTGRIYSSASFRPFDAFALVALYYLLLTSIFTVAGGWAERRLEVYEA